VNTLKSAALVIVLAGVLYGVYVTLHQPPAEPPAGLTKEQVEKDTVPPEVDFGPGAAENDISAVPGGSREESPRKMDPSFPHDDHRGHSHEGGKSSAPPLTLDESLPPGPEVATGVAETQPAGHEAPLTDGNPRASEVNLTAANFKRDWISATYQVDEGKFREALATLTPYYRSPDLQPEQQAQLLEWLDATRRQGHLFQRASPGQPACGDQRPGATRRCRQEIWGECAAAGQHQSRSH